MRSKMFLNILSKYTFALIFAMFLKILIIDIIPSQGYQIMTASLDTEKKVKNTLVYTEVAYIKDDTSFNMPKFGISKVDDYINSYIEDNSCTELAYNILDLGKNRVNVFLNCGNPINKVFDYKKKEEIQFITLVKDYDKFINESKRLLNLKYPTFVVEDIDFEKASYNIKANELIGYYNSSEYGKANIRINYNEIKNLLDYDMHYDDAYQNEVFTLDPNKKTVSFTFDDGPSDYDLELVDLLVNSHSTATFFVVGNRINNFKNSIKKMNDAGMEVGNHTYNHKSLAGLSEAAIREQITKTNDIYRELTGKELALLRPSYGAVNKKVLLQVQMPVILWNLDTLDWKYRNADKVYDEIMNNISDGDIVLMHSLYKSTVEAVDRSLKELYKRGYQVVSISELAKLKNKTLGIGKSYVALK